MSSEHGLTWLLDHTLPLNRKERFYTGTVLPGIVCADFSSLGRLTTLMGGPAVEVTGDPDDCGVLFFTEYGVAESVYGPSTQRLAGLPTNRDTPDVVFLTLRPQPTLYALEAKMYDRPGGAGLRTQMQLQSELLGPLAERLADLLDVDDIPVIHRALLPAAQSGINISPFKAITWEEVGEAYEDIAPAYWRQMLSEALARYPDLVSRTVANDDARLSGEEILNEWEAGSDRYAVMGRSLGLAGSIMQEDLRTGSWKRTLYQVAATDPGNRNWFAIADFVTAVRATEVDPATDLRQSLESACTVGPRVFGDGSVAQSILDADPTALASADPAELRRVAELYRRATDAAVEARRSAADLLGLATRPLD